MKKWHLALSIWLTGVSLFVLSCARSPAATPQNQEAMAKRGDLKIEITATGNLAFSKEDDLSFDMAGNVAEVLVDEGDSVKEGQELVRLDAAKWQDQLDTLNDQVTAADRQVTAKQRDLLQAQVNVQTAQNNLDASQLVKEATDNVTNAESELKLAQAMLSDTGLLGTDFDFLKQYRKQQVADAKTKLADAQKILADILSTNRGVSTTDVAVKQLNIVLSQGRLDDSAKAIDDAKNNLKKAQKTLDDNKKYSTVVKAPYSGVITKVNVLGGDEVKKGTVAVHIADPTKFEADVLVGETDIPQVTEGGDATVQLTSGAGVSLSAKVSKISPTATIQQGVVNYKVKVEVQSPSIVSLGQRQPAAGSANVSGGQFGASGNLSGRQFGASGNVSGRQFGGSANVSGRQPGASGNVSGRQPGAAANITAGQLPEQLQQAIREGRITQEQVDELIQRRQAGLPALGQQGQLGARQQTGLASAGTLQLRQGLTVTVNILVQQKTGVILVPNRAISRQNGQTVVKVMKDGKVESRPVKTGINDLQNTEITDGLSEGEKVVLPQTSTSTSRTTTPGGTQQGPVFRPPGGGLIR